MFDDVDASLRALLAADVPLDPTEVDISFARPTREWSSRLARPTLNLFLFDVRERTDFRDDTWRVTQSGNGMVTRERPPRRIDLSYVLTAWTREPEDEHRILARVLAALYRNLKVAPEHLQGAMKESALPILLRTAAPDHLQKAVDFWGVMDNELRTSLTWIATAPLDAFAPLTGPAVITKEIRTGPLDDAERETAYQVAGQVRDGDAGVRGVRVTVDGTAISTVSGRDGRYSLNGVPAGDHAFVVERGDASGEHAITVPAASYDLPAPAADERSVRSATKPSRRPKKS